MNMRGVVHRDIKPSNILIDHTGYIKLIDFGLAKVLTAANNFKTKSLKGTPMYCAPELIETKNGYSFHVDLWMVGLTLFELITECNPFESISSNDDTFEVILDTDIEYDSFPSQFDSYKPMIQLFLNKKFKERWRTCSEFKILEDKSFWSECDPSTVLNKKVVNVPFIKCHENEEFLLSRMQDLESTNQLTDIQHELKRSEDWGYDLD